MPFAWQSAWVFVCMSSVVMLCSCIDFGMLKDAIYSSRATLLLMHAAERSE